MIVGDDHRRILRQRLEGGSRLQLEHVADAQLSKGNLPFRHAFQDEGVQLSFASDGRHS